ncbi:hypothetical protein D3C81_863680 [compost metagenome]
MKPYSRHLPRHRVVFKKRGIVGWIGDNLAHGVISSDSEKTATTSLAFDGWWLRTGLQDRTDDKTGRSEDLPYVATIDRNCRPAAIRIAVLVDTFSNSWQADNPPNLLKDTVFLRLGTLQPIQAQHSTPCRACKGICISIQASLPP